MKKWYLFFLIKTNFFFFREKDIDGIDINMGCPKEFSIKVLKIM